MSVFVTFVGAALFSLILFGLAKFAPHFLNRVGDGRDAGSDAAAGGSYGEGGCDGGSD